MHTYEVIPGADPVLQTVCIQDDRVDEGQNGGLVGCRPCMPQLLYWQAERGLTSSRLLEKNIETD